MSDSASLPSALSTFEKFIAGFQRKLPALFLDYDGTLSPIVENPDEAVISDKLRQTLTLLQKQVPVVVISGRNMEDVKEKVGVEGLYYAGSHGYDISGPDKFRNEYKEAADLQPVFDRAYAELQRRLPEMPGVRAERKKYAIAIHYRQAGTGAAANVQSLAREIIEKEPALKIGGGKMIVELKPKLNWHKGKALQWLMEKFDTKKYRPLYIGDDLTDEDAFEEIESTGVGVLVGSHGSPSRAAYGLKDVDEVEVFLEMVLAFLKEQKS